jgi:hypothetical protein
MLTAPEFPYVSKDKKRFLLIEVRGRTSLTVIQM